MWYRNKENTNGKVIQNFANIETNVIKSRMLEYLNTPVTVGSFVRECILSLFAGIIVAVIMLIMSFLFFKLFIKVKRK